MKDYNRAFSENDILKLKNDLDNNPKEEKAVQIMDPLSHITIYFSN